MDSMIIAVVFHSDPSGNGFGFDILHTLLKTKLSLSKALLSRCFSFSKGGICFFLRGIVFNEFETVTNSNLYPKMRKERQKPQVW